MRYPLADRPVVVVKLLEGERSEGAGSSVGLFLRATRRCPGRRRVSKSGPEGKSFQIPKQLVWEAYRRVKAKKGAAGVDGQSMADFEEDLRNNLYRLWLCRVEDYAEWAVLGDCLACSRPGQP